MDWWTNDIGTKIMNTITEWFTDQLAEFADNITMSFLTSFKPDITYFNTIFPSAKQYYPAFVAIGAVLTGTIFLFSLLFLLLGIITGYEENPFKMIGRFFIALFMTFYSAGIMNYLYGIGSSFAEMIGGVARLDSLDGSVGILDFIMVDNVNLILKLIMALIIVWNIIKLFLAIIERYLVMCLYWYLAPIANASFASKATSKIFSTFYSALIVQVLVCALNVWFLRLTTDICIAGIVGGDGTTDVLVQGLIAIAWLVVAQRIDQYLRAMGFSASQSVGNLGHSIMGTVFAVSTAVNTGSRIAKAVGAGGSAVRGIGEGVSNGATAFRDSMGRSHATEGNKNVSNAAGLGGGVMSQKGQIVPNQDAYMSTDSKGKSAATIVGEAGKAVVLNSNIPGMESASVIKESLSAGAIQGEAFKFNYKTTDGNAVKGHISRIPEEHGVKGIKSVGKSGQAQYVYYDKNSGLPTGTGIIKGQTSTVYDANLATGIEDETGTVDVHTGAWNRTVLKAIGMENVEMDSTMKMVDDSRIVVETEAGKMLGTVVTSNHGMFESAKVLGNFHEDVRNGNRVVGIPNSNLEGLSLDTISVSQYVGVRSHIGTNAVPKGNKTLETDGIQAYVSQTDDGRVLHHQFVTAENLDYSKLNTYKKVILPNEGVIYHRAQYINAASKNTQGKKEV